MEKKKQIKLNEAQLREFISYSVARILKEDYGYNTIKIEPDLDKYLDELEQGNDESDAFVRKLMEYDVWPVRVRIIYSVTKGMKGDNYLVPDDETAGKFEQSASSGATASNYIALTNKDSDNRAVVGFI